MSSPSASPPYACWASADDWRHGFVMLGANVDSIPTPPPRSPIIIGVDGLWGDHEWTAYPQPHRPDFPYLAWIPLSNTSTPSDVLTRPVQKSMWRAHPDHSNLHIVHPDLFDEFTVKWNNLKDAVQDPFHHIFCNPMAPIERPMKAYTRAFEAFSRLEQDFGAWRDFVEVFRNLQRSLLELRGFLDWWKDIRAGDDFRPLVRPPTRGAIFEDAQAYANYAHWSVASFLLVKRSAFLLDPAKEIALSPRKLGKTSPMSLGPILHSLHHWYYPPVVRDVVTELETAARGYAERLDTFNPTKERKRKLEKLENKKCDEDGRRAKKSKTDMASLVMPLNERELRRLIDAGPPPDWYSVIRGVWKDASNHVRVLNLQAASQESPRRFALPPVQLFWGSEPPNQRIFYYHYLLLFNEIKNRPERGLLPLTTQQWRSILGNTYWKKQWPKPDGNSSNFDPDVFWKYGGPLLFGNERSADIAAGHYNPTSRLSCRCKVQLATTDDTDIRQVVLYYLTSFHVYEEIRDMESLQFPTTFEKRWKDQTFALNQIMEMWDPVGGAVNTDFFSNKDVCRSWVGAVRDLVADWDGFERWDWCPFSNARNIGIDKLSGSDLRKFTVSLLAFFIHSFVTRLGYRPSPLLRPPTLAAHSCMVHAKKFGYAPNILPRPAEE